MINLSKVVDCEVTVLGLATNFASYAMLLLICLAVSKVFLTTNN